MIVFLLPLPLFQKMVPQKFIKNKVKKFIQIRATTQPQGVKTGGSTFTNPKGKKLGN